MDSMTWDWGAQTEAEARFVLVLKSVDAHDLVTYVEAENGSGSRYCVVVSRLSEPARYHLGARSVASLVYPWQAAYPMHEIGPLYASYVADKFHPPGDDRGWHPADLAGVTMTLARAFGVGYLLPRDPGGDE